MQCHRNNPPPFDLKDLVDIKKSITPVQPPAPAAVGTIDFPILSGNCLVKTGIGSTGILCAFGNGNGLPASAVKAKGHCFVGSPTVSPPPGSAECPISNNHWLMLEVPGAQAGVTNNFKVWYLDAMGSVVDSEETSFHGVASSKTDCEGSGQVTSFPAQKRVFLPVIMHASVGGFSDEVAVFNGSWQLHIAASTVQSNLIVWRSSGCSTSSLEVKLVANLDESSAELIIKHKVTEVRYRKSSGEWNPANICEFADVSCRAIQPSASIPAIVHVKPGSGS